MAEGEERERDRGGRLTRLDDLEGPRARGREANSGLAIETMLMNAKQNWDDHKWNERSSN
jgi:hypothetical protein